MLLRNFFKYLDENNSKRVIAKVFETIALDKKSTKEYFETSK